MSRQLTKLGANSRHPNKQAHSGVVKHNSSALQQLSRRQETQLPSLELSMDLDPLAGV